MNGRLYLVATPIGNLEDITLRALKVLEKVDVIAAEDTRHTLKLLNFYAITKPLISYHRHNEEVKSDVLIDKLKNGTIMAVIQRFTSKCVEQDKAFLSDAFSESFRPVQGSRQVHRNYTPELPAESQ